MKAEAPYVGVLSQDPPPDGAKIVVFEEPGKLGIGWKFGCYSRVEKGKPRCPPPPAIQPVETG